MARPIVCPYCKSTRTRGKGTRPTAAFGPRRIRLCKECNHKFTVGVKPLVLVNKNKREHKARGQRS